MPWHRGYFVSWSVKDEDVIMKIFSSQQDFNLRHQKYAHDIIISGGRLGKGGRGGDRDSLTTPLILGLRGRTKLSLL